MTHHQFACLFLILAAILMLVEWVLTLTGRAALRFDLLAWASGFVAGAFLAV